MPKVTQLVSVRSRIHAVWHESRDNMEHGKAWTSRRLPDHSKRGLEEQLRVGWEAKGDWLCTVFSTRCWCSRLIFRPQGIQMCWELIGKWSDVLPRESGPLGAEFQRRALHTPGPELTQSPTAGKEWQGLPLLSVNPHICVPLPASASCSVLWSSAHFSISLIRFLKNIIIIV